MKKSSKLFQVCCFFLLIITKNFAPMEIAKYGDYKKKNSEQHRYIKTFISK